MKSYTIIESGENTCASEPGRFCQFAGAKSFGTRPWCMLFNTELKDINGWLQRSPKCLKNAREVALSCVI